MLANKPTQDKFVNLHQLNLSITSRSNLAFISIFQCCSYDICMYWSLIASHYNCAGTIQMQGKKAEEKAWRQTYLVDKKQLDSFAKDIPKLFPFSMTVAPYAEKISKLLSEADQSQLKINKQQTLTFQKLADITSDINSLRNTLKFYDQTNEYLVKIQSSSESILGKLQHFRGKMGIAYQELADAQDSLNDELQLLNKKIESMGRSQNHQDQKENLKDNNKEVKVWEKRQNIAKNERIKQIVDNEDRVGVIESKMKEKQKEVQSIEKMIASLGKNLGWPEQDHNDFVSIWHRGPHTKNYFQIEQELQAYFAFYTGEQIQQHMNKYMKLRKLNDEKKELIIQYKNLKEAKKIEELKVLDLERQNSRQQKDKQDQKRRNEKEQLQMKVKVAEWKENKMKEKREEQEIKARLERQKKQQNLIKQREIQQRNKQLLDKWKQQEAHKKQQIRRIKSAKKPVPIDPEAEQRIRLREELLVQKKLQFVNGRKRQQQMQKIKQSRLKEQKFVKYSHVGARLDQKTTAMKEKERQKFDGKEKKQANTFGGQLLMTGVRATPSWMK